MVLEKIALLASNTARTKAYIQKMIKDDMLPAVCILYADDISQFEEELDDYEESVGIEYFNLNEPLLYSLNKANVPYVYVENKDINSVEMSRCIANIQQEYLVYSGYGGYILRKHLFELGKKYLHVHAGILPQYRGSTTVYYSLLQEGIMGATCIFLNEEIDEGEIIAQGSFALPEKYIDIDYVYEPYIRSCVLSKALAEYKANGVFASHSQEKENAEIYYIIHPVLKHFVLLGQEVRSE
ncbi:MAG: hypothetical protein IJ661_04585 [Lachnospiraceae bacterium]|nr:hypothetical protein [Lachnospiraceae bacterium]